MGNPLLSICIPTYNRAYFLKHALMSIVVQPIFVQSDEVEVVVSDNCSEDKTREVVASFVEKFGAKIRYYRTTTNIRDANFGIALAYGRGEYLKLHNDSIHMVSGSLEKMVSAIKRWRAAESLLYFANGNAKISQDEGVRICETPDMFLETASYFVTWIGSCGVWRADFKGATDFNADVACRLTQVRYLFRQLKAKRRSVVVNLHFGDGMKVPAGKINYDVAEVFGWNYAALLKQAHDEGAFSMCAVRRELKNVLSFVNQYYFDPFKLYETEGKYWHFMQAWHGFPCFYQQLVLSAFRQWRKRKSACRWRSRISHKAWERVLWAKNNKSNGVRIVSFDALSPMQLATIAVGKGSYGAITVRAFGTVGEGLVIGERVSIAEGVCFVLGGEHPHIGFSTYPFRVRCLGVQCEAGTKGPIVIEDDVWIGTNALILSGVTIGQGAIIGAGAVIAKDVPPYAIVVGNPARVVKYRFPEAIVKKLLDFDFMALTEEKIKACESILYTPLSLDNVDEILNRLTVGK